jgi:hypothetical protein
MAMSMDEKAAKILSQVVEQRLLPWPARRAPDAIRDSAFILSHAHLLKARRILFLFNVASMHGAIPDAACLVRDSAFILSHAHLLKARSLPWGLGHSPCMVPSLWRMPCPGLCLHPLACAPAQGALPP